MNIKVCIKYILFILVALLAIGGYKGYKFYNRPSQTIATNALIKGYENADALQSAADIIVIGEPEKDFSEYSPTIRYNNEGRISDYYTVTDIHVLKILKGDYNSATIPVMQSAVLINSPFKKQKDLLTTEGYSVMKKGNKYLLFLRKTTKGNYSIMSVTQGKFNIDGLDAEEKIYGQNNKQWKDLQESVFNKYNTLLDN